MVGILRASLILGILWYLYGSYVWLTNREPPRQPQQQLLLLIGMAGFLGTAVAIPELFDQTGPLFGIGYVVVVAVHSLMFRQAAPQTGWARIVPFHLVSAVLVLVAGLTARSSRPWLLVAALVVQALTLLLGVAPSFEVRARHFVERHGLLMIVALGETVIAVGLGVDPTNLDGLVLVTLLLVFAIPAGLWWDFFANESQSAVAALEGHEQATRSRVAIQSYFYAHIPMLFGIVILGAGIHEALLTPAEPLAWAAAAALGGGVGTFLLGDAGFRRALGLGHIHFRVVAALIAYATIPLGTLLPAWLHSLGLVAVTIGLILVERTSPRIQTSTVA